MQDRAEKKRINQMLRNHGLPTLNAASGLMEALGRQVLDHDHLRSLLVRCEPQERGNMYASLKPHLRFAPKPLDVYIAQAGHFAEAKQLPTLEAGRLREYRPPILKTKWFIVLNLADLNKERLLQAMRYLKYDIPEDQLELVIYKVFVRPALNGTIEMLTISASVYENGEPQRIQ